MGLMDDKRFRRLNERRKIPTALGISGANWDWFDHNDNVISKDWSWLQTIINTLEEGKRLNMHCGSGAQE